MKLHAVLIAGCVAVAALAACSQVGPAAPPAMAADMTPPVAAPAGMAALSAAGNRFSIALYREQGKAPGNVILSPVSIASAFALLQPGARGETASELARVFGFDAVAPEKFADAMGALLAALETHVAPMPQPATAPAEGSPDYWALRRDPAVDLAIANRAWLKTGFALKPDYAETLQRAFGAGVVPVDFADQQAAAGEINAWVASQTNDRIRSLIDPGSIDPAMTRLILTNAVWFKARWRDSFEPEATQDSSFFGRDGAPMPARLMRRTGDMPWFKGDGFSAVALAYTHPDFSLTVLLPDQKSGLAALEASLSDAAMLGALQAVRTAAPREVALTLPKATLDGRFTLNDTIKALGAPRAFDPHLADLSGLIEGATDLSISDAVHVTWFQLDETHTEAAAATSIGIVATSAPMPEPEPVIFRADHPFLLALTHVPTGTILFLGRVERVAP